MYVRATASATSREDAQPLLIPHSAPLITGKRAVVYTLDHAGEGPAFVGREVELGDRVDEGYVVLSGLEEGERVVTRGAFQIDSSLQILARPSMMNPEGGIAVEGHAGHGIPTGESAHQMAPAGSSSEALSAEGARQLLPAYLKIQSALAADDFETARAEWPILLATIVTAGDHELHQAAIGNATASIANMRLAFLAVSIKVIPHIDSLDQPVVHVHCPMAFDGKGSNWLQLSQEIANPYFGAAMLRCGTIKGEVTP
jgi:Cu(I)/Ag(I) efflux system membrane fusion protein